MKSEVSPPSPLGALVHVSPTRSAIGGIAASQPPDGSGRTWHPVRVIALSTSSAQPLLGNERMQVADRPEGRVGMVYMPGGPGDPDIEVLWANFEVAVPIVQAGGAAAAIALHLLPRMDVTFAVEGCIVWIGDLRYWVAFAPSWPTSSKPASVEDMPFPGDTHASDIQ